jgi:hypothetical protein
MEIALRARTGPPSNHNKEVEQVCVAGTSVKMIRVLQDSTSSNYVLLATLRHALAALCTPYLKAALI